MFPRRCWWLFPKRVSALCNRKCGGALPLPAAPCGPSPPVRCFRRRETGGQEMQVRGEDWRWGALSAGPCFGERLYLSGWIQVGGRLAARGLQQSHDLGSKFSVNFRRQRLCHPGTGARCAPFFLPWWKLVGRVGSAGSQLPTLRRRCCLEDVLP